MSWFNQNKRIFLDYASATPVLPEVEKAMEKYFSQDFYNSSAIYEEGVRVGKEMQDCRARVARALGVSPKDIIFTSGGTESDNLAILGTFEKSFEKFERPHIIISSIEHPAVIASAEEVVRRGGEMSVLPVDEEGIVSSEALKKLLKKNTFLVSVSLANGEIGTIEPVSKLARIVKEYRKKNKSIYPYFHTDASQAVGFLGADREKLQADLITLDSSKIYGPKGVGALVVRNTVKMYPTIFGGMQEGGRRAGTINPALISGFTIALEIALKDMEKESKRLEAFRQYFIESVEKNLPGAIVNGAEVYHLPNILSISIPGVLSELILLKLDRAGVLASAGSTCSYDETISGSPVIRALGKDEVSESTIRFSFGRFTTQDDIKSAVEIFCRISKPMIK